MQTIKEESVYKYLTDKFEETSGAYFDSICFITNEIARESESEFIEDMLRTLDDSEICKLLKWRDEEDVHEIIKEHIEEKNFAWFIGDSGKHGVIGCGHFPELTNFSKTGNSYHVHKCSCVVKYFYADSYPELVEKLVKYSSVHEKKCKERDNAKQS